MTILTTAQGTDYSTIYIPGLPPFGLRREQYNALGTLAADVKADQAARIIRIPPERQAPRGAGWAITAPTGDIGPIQAVAQAILDGRPDSLPARYRDTKAQENNA